MYILEVLVRCAFVCVCVSAQPQLHSSIGYLLSGQYCPNYITLTCTALNFSSNGLIDWLTIADTTIASYRYNKMDGFPVTVMTHSSVLNATVQIVSASSENAYFNFETTLRTNLDDLVPLQGQAITCGVLSDKSANALQINKFNIIDADKTVNVNYTAFYDSVGDLYNINLKWDLFLCNSKVNYTIEYHDESGASSIAIDSESCTDKICSVDITVKGTTTVTVQAHSPSGDSNDLTAYNYIHGSIDSILKYELLLQDCVLNIKCNSIQDCSITYSFDYDDCTKNFTESNGDHISISDISLRKNYCIEIMSVINSTTAILRLNYSARSIILDGNVALVAIGVPAMILGFGILVIGCLLGLYKFKCHFAKIQCHFPRIQCKLYYGLIIFVYIMLAFMFILALSLWISYGSTSTSGSCSRNLHSIAISATTISLVLLILSPFSLIGFLLNRNISGSAKIPSIQKLDTAIAYEVGTSNSSYSGNLETCVGCQHNSGKAVVRHACYNCKKFLCGKCIKKNKAYIKFTGNFQYVCDTCNDAYWKENKQLFDEKQIGEVSATMCTKNKDKCRECSKDSETSTLTLCPCCKMMVCNAGPCCDKEITLDGKKNTKVCNTCFMLYQRFHHKKGNSSPKLCN